MCTSTGLLMPREDLSVLQSFIQFLGCSVHNKGLFYERAFKMGPMVPICCES